MTANCPTCKHPAVQHLLVSVGTKGIATCKVCGAASYESGEPLQKCDFAAVLSLVKRVYAKNKPTED
jgi:transcription elongation factor Elf1